MLQILKHVACGFSQPQAAKLVQSRNKDPWPQDPQTTRLAHKKPIQVCALLDSQSANVGLVIGQSNMLVLMRGFDSIFRVCAMAANGILTNEVCLLEKWGQTTKKKLIEWIDCLKKHGDVRGQENLRLSGVALRRRLGTTLLGRVNVHAGAKVSGPEVFREAVNLLNDLPPKVVQILSNKLGSLKLKEVPGENMSKLGEEVLKQVDKSKLLAQRQMASRPWLPILLPLAQTLNSCPLQRKFTTWLPQAHTLNQFNAW